MGMNDGWLAQPLCQSPTVLKVPKVPKVLKANRGVVRPYGGGAALN
jgi:hypothetical protein